MAAEYRQLPASWSSRLGAGAPVLLDGALGTELERRGVPSSLPLWSTQALLEAPDTVSAIHREYALAGAEVLTAGTFRTQQRTLARAGDAGLEGEAAALTRHAVLLARRAAEAAPRTCWVAGSAPPLEDCYRPDLVPADDVAAAEHREHIAHLVEAGIDVIAVETMNCVREARIAARAAADSGVPFWVSFVCDPDALLLSGESLRAAIDAVRDAGPTAVGVNCVPPSAVAGCLPVLRSCGIDFLVYANLGMPEEDGSRSEEQGPTEFAGEVDRWTAAGARMVGGCCGTRPDHIRAVADALTAHSPTDE
jgi:S-methylmethionine-dependent homocysteine/selenocysteine methylase